MPNNMLPSWLAWEAASPRSQSCKEMWLTDEKFEWLTTWSRLEKAKWLTDDTIWLAAATFSPRICRKFACKAISWCKVNMNPSSEWNHWSMYSLGITACDCHRPAVNEITVSCLRRILSVTWHEAPKKTVGQDVLETTPKKGWLLCWSCAMHGRLQKSKTKLDSWWEQKLRSTMHYIARYNLERYWPDGHEDVCPREWKGKSGKIYFLIY